MRAQYVNKLDKQCLALQDGAYEPIVTFPGSLFLLVPQLMAAPRDMSGLTHQQDTTKCRRESGGICFLGVAHTTDDLPTRWPIRRLTPWMK